MGASVKNERGQVFVAAAVSLAAFLALTVVAVDIGRLAHTATEVQAVADVAASAGATALLKKTFARANVDPIAEAQFVAGQNTMDGQAAVVTDIALLHYDFASGGFTSGSPNAVRATPSVTVTNLIAGVLGDRQTTVTKTATAAMSGVGAASPSLPMVIGVCSFNAFQTSLSCGDLPSLIQAPTPDNNSAWTSLTGSSASASAVDDYLPAVCGGTLTASVTVGDMVNVLNGQTTSLLKAVADCVCTHNVTKFTVPVVPCGSFNQAMTVSGFATVQVLNVSAPGNNGTNPLCTPDANGKTGITLQTICNTDDAGGGGGGNFGTETVAMVE